MLLLTRLHNQIWVAIETLIVPNLEWFLCPVAGSGILAGWFCSAGQSFLELKHWTMFQRGGWGPSHHSRNIFQPTISFSKSKKRPSFSHAHSAHAHIAFGGQFRPRRGGGAGRSILGACPTRINNEMVNGRQTLYELWFWRRQKNRWKMNTHRSGSNSGVLLPQHIQDVSLDLTSTSTELKPSLRLTSKLTKWLR